MQVKSSLGSRHEYTAVNSESISITEQATRSVAPFGGGRDFRGSFG